MFLRKSLQIKIIKFVRKANFSIWNMMMPRKEQTKVSKFDHVEIYMGKKSREILTNGINQISSTVAKTYGPMGRNVAIYKDNPLITKDGVSVAKNIVLNDRGENIGVRLLSLAAGQTNQFAGDGTTTSTILSGEITKMGVNLVNLGYHPIEMKKGVNIAASRFLDYLEQRKIRVRRKSELYSLAMITTNNHEEISKIVSEALITLGIHGIINIEENNVGENQLIISEGMSISNGLASRDFITDKTGNNQVEVNKALLLVVKDSIDSIESIIKPLEYAKNSKKSIIIFSEHLKSEPLSLLVFNRRNNGLNCYGVNVPDYSQIEKFNHSILDDISSVSGAKSLTKEDLKDFSPEFFGNCEFAVITEFETMLVGCKGDKLKINNRIKEIKAQIQIEEDLTLRDFLKLRLTRMEGKSAIIGVGGFTDIEKGENRDKIVDCLNSCKSALEFGILPGGGTTYVHGLKIIENLEKSENFSRDIHAGIGVFYQAMKNLLYNLFSNCKQSPELIVHNISQKQNDLYGYNVLKDSYSENMIEEGIIDSFSTIKTSIEDAVSVGGLLMTTECLIRKKLNYNPPPLDFFKNKLKKDPNFRRKAEEDFLTEDGRDNEII